MVKIEAQLHLEALQLYEMQRSAQYFANHFTRAELLDLWNNRCTYKYDRHGKLQDPEAYDDEVYDALAITGYWDAITEWKRG